MTFIRDPPQQQFRLMHMPTPIKHAPSRNHQNPSGSICESRTMTPTVTMIHPTGFFRRFPRRINSPPMRTMFTT